MCRSYQFTFIHWLSFRCFTALFFVFCQEIVFGCWHFSDFKLVLVLTSPSPTFTMVVTPSQKEIPMGFRWTVISNVFGHDFMYLLQTCKKTKKTNDVIMFCIGNPTITDCWSFCCYSETLLTECPQVFCSHFVQHMHPRNCSLYLLVCFHPKPSLHSITQFSVSHDSFFFSFFFCIYFIYFIKNLNKSWRLCFFTSGWTGLNF